MHLKRSLIAETLFHHHSVLFFFRFPNIACELLTSDVSIINDKLGAEESLLEMLYNFLEQDPPLNPLLASFFSKTIGNLIARKTEQVRWKRSLLTNSFLGRACKWAINRSVDQCYCIDKSDIQRFGILETIEVKYQTLTLLQSKCTEQLVLFSRWSLF